MYKGVEFWAYSLFIIDYSALVQVTGDLEY